MAQQISMPKTKLEQFAELQPLIRKEIEDVSKTVFTKMMGEDTYTNFATPNHIHNGSDALRINAWDIVKSQAASGSITMATDDQRYSIGLNTKPGTAFAPSQIRFNGIVIYSLADFTISSSSVTAGAVYTVEGLEFTVLATIAPDTTLETEGPGSTLTATSGTLTKVSGTGPSTISFSNVSVTNTRRALVVGDAFIGPSFYLQPGDATSVTVGGTAQVVVQSSSNLLINDSGSGPVTQASVSEGHVVSVIYSGSVVARATFPDLGVFGANELPIQAGNLIVDVTLEPGWTIIGNFVII